jgi:hypothetical protein
MSNSARPGDYPQVMDKDERISLAPLKPTEALRALLGIDPKVTEKGEAKSKPERHHGGNGNRSSRPG